MSLMPIRSGAVAACAQRLLSNDLVMPPRPFASSLSGTPAAGAAPPQLRSAPFTRPEADNGMGPDPLSLLPPLPSFLFGEGPSFNGLELAEHDGMAGAGPGNHTIPNAGVGGAPSHVGAAGAALAEAEEAAAAASAAAAAAAAAAATAAAYAHRLETSAALLHKIVV